MIFGLHNGIGRPSTYKDMPFALSKVIFSVNNTVKQCNPDFTSVETLFTWTAETNITGLACDHVNERIFMIGDTLGTIRHIDFDGSNDTLFHTIGVVPDNAKLAIDDFTSVLIFQSSGGFLTGVGSVSTMPLAGGSPTVISSDAMLLGYSPAIQRISVTEPSGTDSLEEYDVVGLNNLNFGITTACKGGFHNRLTDCILAGSNTNIFSRHRDFVGNVTWFSDAGANWFQMEYDFVNNNAYAMSSGNNIPARGIYLFTQSELSSTTSTNPRLAGTANYDHGADSNRAMGLCLKYNKSNWQSLV